MFTFASFWAEVQLPEIKPVITLIIFASLFIYVS